jgi:hypothetical protein
MRSILLKAASRSDDFMIGVNRWLQKNIAWILAYIIGYFTAMVVGAFR